MNPIQTPIDSPQRPTKSRKHILYLGILILVTVLVIVLFTLDKSVLDKSVAVKLLSAETGDAISYARVEIVSGIYCLGPCDMGPIFYGNSDGEGLINIPYGDFKKFKSGDIFASAIDNINKIFIFKKANAQVMDTKSYEISIYIQPGQNEEKPIFGLNGEKYYTGPLNILDNNTILVGPFRYYIPGGRGSAVAIDSQTGLPIRQKTVYAMEKNDCIPQLCSRFIKLSDTNQNGNFSIPSWIKEYSGHRYAYIPGYLTVELPSGTEFYKTGDFTKVFFRPKQ